MCDGARLLLAHAHVVDDQLLRECRCRVRIARPLPTDGEIQNDEERQIVHPSVASTNVAGRLGGNLGAVHVPIDQVLRPFNGKYMKVRAHELPIR